MREVSSGEERRERICEAAQAACVDRRAQDEPEAGELEAIRPEGSSSLMRRVLDRDNLVRALRQVQRNKGAPGIDGMAVDELSEHLRVNWESIRSSLEAGRYRPQPVRRVVIPKPGGGERKLGIPTVSDRIAQMVVKLELEPHVEPIFHPDSYGYRPGKSALDAVGVTRQRCWRANWVIDLDIKGFFDNLDWQLLQKALRHHTDVPWILLYVERWLKAPLARPDGSLEERTKGTPQGSVISPLLSNLFMHYAFDDWLRRNHPHVQFARYADDAVLHAGSLDEAEQLLEAVRARLRQCGLELHPDKTKIVYCQDSDRRGSHDHIQFDFLGYTFRPRRAKNRWGKMFVSFLPGVSNKAAKSIRATIRSWRLGATRNNQSLEEIARFVNPFVRGWVNYYGRYYRSALTPVLRDLERSLVYWARRKFKRLSRHPRRAAHWLGRVAQREPALFELWRFGIRPATGQ